MTRSPGAITTSSNHTFAARIDSRVRVDRVPVAFHPDVADDRVVGEQVALHCDDVGELADLERALPRIDAEHARRVHRERGEGDIAGQAALDRRAQVLQELVVVEAVRREGELHARGGETGGVLGSDVPVAQDVETDVERSLRRLHVRRVGKVERHDLFFDPEACLAHGEERTR